MCHLLLRASLAPGLMVGLCLLLGFRGELAAALVVLSILPVAQTAFVVCKQYDTGMAPVALVMVASVLLMLPQLLLTLGALQWLGLFEATGTAAA